MNILTADWSSPELVANGLIMLNIIGAAILGMAMGYERSYHGHAAGIRTYGLVCMAAAALTAICGDPGLWFGAHGVIGAGISIGPTQVIQGIVTGVGFLGAGVIMREGFTIRGLSTAASIWSTSAIGIIVGVGFYSAAIVATILVLVIMGSFKKLELRLPHRRQMRLILIYRVDRNPVAEEMTRMLGQQGFMILEMSCQNDNATKHFTYDLVLQGDGTHNFNQLIENMRQTDSLTEFSLSPVRD